MKTTNIPLNIEGEIFDKNIYKKSGIFILRNFINKKTIKELQETWTTFNTDLNKNGGRIIDEANHVNFKDVLPPKMLNFWQSRCIKNISKIIYKNNVALYHHRIVIKDKNSLHKVFLHQDYCYHVGFPDKSNLFIPLFNYGAKHGTLSFYPGTHQYGFLGDAGQIDPTKFHAWEKITPNIKAGDVVIMNSCLWHESSENKSDIDRVIFDIIIQPSSDPSGAKLICGEWETDFWIGRKEDHTFLIDTLFIDSRIKKIKNFNKL